jgi:hypothetical protein
VRADRADAETTAHEARVIGLLVGLLSSESRAEILQRTRLLVRLECGLSLAPGSRMDSVQ